MISMIISYNSGRDRSSLKEYDKRLKERLIETFGAGQDYCEQLLKNLGFDD